MQHLANEIDLKLHSSRFRVHKIIRLAYIDKSQDWKILLHSHDDHCEIIYVESGKGEYTIDQKQYSIKAGDIILINSRVGHVQISDPDEPLISWNLAIQTCRTEWLSENQLIPNDVIPVLSSGNEEPLIKMLYHQLYFEGLHKPTGFEAAALLYAELIRLNACRMALANEEKLPRHRKALPEQIKGYIDDHYNEKITLDEIADHFFINKYHIIHMMKKEYGISPIDYLVSRRIGEAQNMLNTTPLSVAEIAASVGYPDKNYFARVFRKRVGMSPIEFRNRYQTI